MGMSATARYRRHQPPKRPPLPRQKAPRTERGATLDRFGQPPAATSRGLIYAHLTALSIATVGYSQNFLFKCARSACAADARVRRYARLPRAAHCRAVSEQERCFRLRRRPGPPPTAPGTADP